jgi:putative flippase GtrA
MMSGYLNRLIDQPSYQRVGIALLQFARFLMTGLLNTAFGYSVFAVVYAVSGHAIVSIVTSNIVGALFNFYSMRRFVFDSDDRASTLAKFLSVYGVVLGLNILGAQFTAELGINPLLGQAMLLPALVGTSFILNKFFVFRRSR